jgi:hypothetical protein
MTTYTLPPHIDGVCSKAYHVLSSALTTKLPLVRERPALQRLQDDLYGACEFMERSGDAEDVEDVYLCVFDCLSYVASSIRGPGVKVDYLRLAIQQISKLRTLTQPAE